MVTAMSLLSLILWAWLGTALWMTGLWIIQLFTRNAAIVDVGWTVSLPVLHLYFALQGGGDPWRSGVLASLVGLWGFRLGGYLFWTRARPGVPEEGRYLRLRQEWGSRFQWNLFCFYQAQAAAALFLSSLFLPIYRCASPWSGTWELMGLALFLLGFAGVTLADSQLQRFKDNPQNHGQVCEVGLWNYSRHPNYFFESLLWCGWATFGLACPGGWLAWLAPLSILWLVLRVTGIPPTEEQAVRSKGEAYRRYQLTTSAFVPWFKRQESR